MQSPVDREILESIDALLDEALHDTVVRPTDVFQEAEFRRQRNQGLGLMVAACAWIAIGTLLPAFEPINAGVPFHLVTAAPTLMSVGLWWADEAGKREFEHHCRSATDECRAALSKTRDAVLVAISHRRRQLGVSMLVAACGSMCIAAPPLPGKAWFVTAMWAGLSLVQVGIGTWLIRRAAKESVRAQAMRDAALRRKASQAKTHLRRVQ